MHLLKKTQNNQSTHSLLVITCAGDTYKTEEKMSNLAQLLGTCTK